MSFCLIVIKITGTFHCAEEGHHYLFQTIIPINRLDRAFLLLLLLIGLL